MAVSIYQGNERCLERADINIVIDVIRAFTVAHIAFLQGAREILLVQTVRDAFQLKQERPDRLLAGEVKGLPIKGFDFDNSPLSLLHEDLSGKTLVQKTTNGVKAALHSLDAASVFVTGFSNARKTAEYIRQLAGEKGRELQVNLIASHPTGDEDLACAEYMAGIMGEGRPVSKEGTVARILGSPVADKFFDPSNPDFNSEDLSYCTREINGDFLMKIQSGSRIPKIERYKA